MADEVIIEQCSPTLAGIKTANLFPVKYRSLEEIKKDIRTLNKRISSKGLRIIPVSYGKGRALLYLYRPAHLKKDLADREAVKILSDMG